MEKIGVIVNRPKDRDLVVTRRIVDFLTANGVNPILSHELQTELGAGIAAQEADLFRDSDAIVCLGGDGTFLKAARKTYGIPRPILGINLGTVGFLAEVETKDVETALHRLIHEDMTIKPRMVLRAEVLRNGTKVFSDIAINDAVVARMALSRILDVTVRVDDQFVDAFPGDGLIVSTPTGSTAYTLSAGGPIVQPDIDLVVVTPICPHILYSRSFVISSGSCLHVAIGDKRQADAMLTVDGQDGFELELGDIVEITRAPHDILFASVCHLNFYDVLRAKIHTRR